MLVVGAKEEEENKVSVRSRFAGDEGVKDLSEFIDAICKEIQAQKRSARKSHRIRITNNVIVGTCSQAKVLCRQTA